MDDIERKLTLRNAFKDGYLLLTDNLEAESLVWKEVFKRKSTKHLGTEYLDANEGAK